MATTPGLWGGGRAEASADDSNTSEFIILGNAHYDYTEFLNLTYEDANAFYDSLKSHGWTCRDYKAHDTTDRGDSYYGTHSGSPEAHNPNASGTRPEAVAEEILSTDFYGDLSDEADSADLFYFMGHGVNSAYGKYGICCLHKYSVSSPSPTNQYFSPQDVGNSWSKDQRCLQEIRPGTTDASLQPLREIRRTSLLTNEQEVMGYVVKFAQYVGGLRVAGANRALVWVSNQGVKLARVRWFEGQAPAVAGLAIDEAQASGIALGAVDCCQGVPAQTGVEMVYHRPRGQGGLTVAWEVSFDDGQRVYVDARSGAVLP